MRNRQDDIKLIAAICIPRNKMLFRSWTWNYKFASETENCGEEVYLFNQHELQKNQIEISILTVFAIGAPEVSTCSWETPPGRKSSDS